MMSYDHSKNQNQGFDIDQSSSSYTYSSSYSSSCEPWIEHFCGQRANEYLVKIDEEFIRDGFNLYGLSSQIEFFDDALKVIMDDEYYSYSDIDDHQIQVETDAQLLYGLIHARYIITGDGLDDMYQKFADGVYGSCPRVACRKQHLLPIGESNIPGVHTVKVFCPCCKELYYPSNNAVAYLDGAYFGTTFASMFMLTFPEIVNQPMNKMEPTIFGFKIHPSSSYYKFTSQEKKENNSTTKVNV